MATLSVEEPDALMCARPDLWEPWAGKCPGPPGPPRFDHCYLGASVGATDAGWEHALDAEVDVNRRATIFVSQL